MPAMVAEISSSRSGCGTTPPAGVRPEIDIRSRVRAHRRSAPRRAGGDGHVRSVNCKPSYLSAMNYLFQVRGLIGTNGPVIGYSGQDLQLAAGLSGPANNDLDETQSHRDRTQAKATPRQRFRHDGMPERTEASHDSGLPSLSIDEAL